MKFAFKSWIPFLELHIVTVVSNYCIITVQLRKPWIRQIFKEYYCVANTRGNRLLLEFQSNKKSCSINFSSTIQISESSYFYILWPGDDFRSGIIYGTIWESFPVLGSFAVQCGDHCGPGSYPGLLKSQNRVLIRSAPRLDSGNFVCQHV